MHEIDLLTSPVLLLGAGFLIILICRRIHISPIIGFLLGGIVLGPHGFNVVPQNDVTAILADLGLVFLLFDIGLQFSLPSVWMKRNTLFGIAPLQMLLSGIILGFVVALVFQVRSDFALLAGVTLALSSTAVVMRILQDMKLKESAVGQSSKAILIFQDIVAIFLLIFAGTVGGSGALEALVSVALIKTLMTFVAAVVLGRYVLTPLMQAITGYKDPELLTILSLFLVIVTAYATAQVGLSLTLGAFLAGMVMAETPYRVLLQTELRPFRNLLMAFFFIKIGILLEPDVIYAHWHKILSFMVFLMATKAAIMGAILFIFKRPPSQVLTLSFLLCQGSEFAFVIFSMVSVQAGMGGSFAQQLIAATALSMMLTPLLSYIAYKYSQASMPADANETETVKTVRGLFSER